MRAIITGASGFIGGYLAVQCRDSGCSVLGLGVTEPGDSWPGGAFEPCDVRDETKLSRLISSFRPDYIFHLAAQSYPTVSMSHPRETIDINVGGTVNVFECARSLTTVPVVVVACSSAEYGFVGEQDLPVRETHPLRPLHPYGVSKVAQDLLAAQYFANYSIPAIRIRIFNTTGPGKIGDVCSDLTKRAVEIEMGMRSPSLLAGNMTSRRALVDVRDMVRALWLAAESCEAGEVYNVGGGKIYSVQEVIDAIRSKVNRAFRVEQDRTLLRACDEPTIAGDISKFHTCTGWRAEIGLAKTVQDMLDWWRNRLTSEASSRQRMQESQSQATVVDQSG